VQVEAAQVGLDLLEVIAAGDRRLEPRRQASDCAPAARGTDLGGAELEGFCKREWQLRFRDEVGEGAASIEAITEGCLARGFRRGVWDSGGEEAGGEEGRGVDGGSQGKAGL
jgi:hypothetical protein